MAAVSRIEDTKPYIQTGHLQRILGFAWRIVDDGKDLTEVKRALELMPVSLGVVFLKASVSTILERNKAREKVEETAHENRSFQVPLMLAGIEYAREILTARGVRVCTIDVEHQTPDQSRKQLIEFAGRAEPS